MLCYTGVHKQPTGRTLHLVICLFVLGQCQNSCVLKAEGKQIHLSWFCPCGVNASCLWCDASSAPLAAAAARSLRCMSHLKRYFIVCSCISAGLGCHPRRDQDHAPVADLPVAPCSPLTLWFTYQWVVLPVLKGKDTLCAKAPEICV